ncbi:UNKNOWN [Stylonychia lemnae]|uniref:Uncharacterized protein n=1 Tax=Stylonychia lemnae TaxID=5949 RepID=A0A077ZT66_STYLE|nr:UNKNOWN [Stylonychia lemnae]|eukprot:CDW72505.1 UNKNOWN [Stylonychia lemnae]
MCLFPMGGGGFNMQPVVPPTQKGLVHKQRLYIVMIVHLVLSIFYMFFNIMGGIFELFSVAILWCASAQMNYCQLIIYMVIQGNKLITTFATVAIAFSFYAYREFKGMMFDHGQSNPGGLGNLLGQNMGGGMGMGQQRQQQSDNSIPLMPQNNNRQQQQQPPAYANNNNNAYYQNDMQRGAPPVPQSQPNQGQGRGQFVPFSGQGVRIG